MREPFFRIASQNRNLRTLAVVSGQESPKRLKLVSKIYDDNEGALKTKDGLYVWIETEDLPEIKATKEEVE